MDYKNKNVLAPMVRVGTLPFRQLVRQYGADIVYGEEIVDFKMLNCKRLENDTLGTVDFIDRESGAVIFRTCADEKEKVVFQVGTADPTRALKTAEIVSQDIAVFDVNMGCPRHFSISGGMGAALLSKPELIRDILTTLKRNLSIPISCKIRILNSVEATVELAKAIELTGVSALAVHGRRVKDRPRDRAQWDSIKAVASALSIPVIANGDVFSYEDFEKIRSETGASAAMAARSALWNPSVFSPEKTDDWQVTKKKYLKECILWDNDVKLTKYTIKEMIMHHSNLELEEGKGVNRCKTLKDLSDLYGTQDFYDKVMMTRNFSKVSMSNAG